MVNVLSLPFARLAQWYLYFQDFDFSIVHKPGECNKVLDALFRNPLPATDTPMDLLSAHAMIGSLDLSGLPPVVLADQPSV